MAVHWWDLVARCGALKFRTLETPGLAHFNDQALKFKLVLTERL